MPKSTYATLKTYDKPKEKFGSFSISAAVRPPYKNNTCDKKIAYSQGVV